MTKYIDDDKPLDRTPDRSRERMSERTDERRLERPNTGHLTEDGPFSIDPALVPKGYTLEWKRQTLLGMEDKRNQVRSQQYHWTPVPHKMQPHILGHLEKDENAPIIVGGLMLMMRPTYLCDEARKETMNETKWQTDNQLDALQLQSREQVGSRYTKIKRTTVAAQAVD